MTTGPTIPRAVIRKFQPSELRICNQRQIPDPAKYAWLSGSILPPNRQEEPGVVAPDPDGKFEVLSGSTRATILTKAGLPFEAIVREDLDTPTKRKDFIVTTDVKSDRHPMEKALAIDACLDETGESQKDAAKRWNMTQVQLCRLLAPIKMHSEILAAYRADPKVVTPSHLAALRKCPEDARRLELLARIKAEKLTAEEVRKLAVPKAKRCKKSAETATLHVDGLTLTFPLDLTVEAYEGAIDKLREEVSTRLRGKSKKSFRLAEVTAAKS